MLNPGLQGLVLFVHVCDLCGLCSGAKLSKTVNTSARRRLGHRKATAMVSMRHTRRAVLVTILGQPGSLLGDILGVLPCPLLIIVFVFSKPFARQSCGHVETLRAVLRSSSRQNAHAGQRYHVSMSS